MVRNFKGVVKVADVQAEFDNLLNAINSKIDTYNNSLSIEDVDYNNGGSDLAPYGYTLSVGGLKKVLAAYDGAILGGNVLRVSDGHYIVSEGIYIKDGQVYRLPSRVLEGEGKKVYYHPNNGKYSFSERSGYEMTIVGCTQDENYIIPNSLATRGSTIEYTNSGFSGLNEGAYYVAGSSSENKLGSSYILLPFVDSFAYTFPCAYPFYSHDVLLGYFNNGEWQTVIEIPSLYSGASTARSYITGEPGYVSSNYFYPTSTYESTYDSTNRRYTMTGREIFSGTYENAGIVTEPYSHFGVYKTILQVRREDRIVIRAFTGTGSALSYNYRPEYTATSRMSQSDYEKITHIAIIPDEGMVTDGKLAKADFGMFNIGTQLAGRANELEWSNGTFDGKVNELIVPTGEVGILVSKVNTNRISRLCNTQNAVNESIPDYKVTIESKNSGYAINGNQYLSNSDKGQFYSGSAGRNCAINLFDTQVAYHHWGNDRSDSYHEPLSFMFIPKGISNPYNNLSGETVFAMQKVWNYILKRPER